MPYGVLAIGHPDPRENARGGQSDINPLDLPASTVPRNTPSSRTNWSCVAWPNSKKIFFCRCSSPRSPCNLPAGCWRDWQNTPRPGRPGKPAPLLQHRHFAAADALRGAGAQRRYRRIRVTSLPGRRMASRTSPARAIPTVRPNPTPKASLSQMVLPTRIPKEWQPPKAIRNWLAIQQAATSRKARAKAGMWAGRLGCRAWRVSTAGTTLPAASRRVASFRTRIRLRTVRPPPIP